MRNFTALLILALTTTAPLALAQDDGTPKNETRPDDAAWVDDCPPDMMCAAGGEGEEPSRGPSDGTCESCRGEEQPEPVLYYGNDTCIECSGPIESHAGTCMDGAQDNETCRDDVQYFSGSGAPEETGPISSHSDAEPTKSAVPAPAVALAILGLAGALVLVGRRK